MAMIRNTLRFPRNQAVTPRGVRGHNERVFLSCVQAHDGIASGEIARKAGFSAQTGSVIARALENEGLVQRGKPKGGRVGKPVTPLYLDPEGASSFGLRIGRRRAELVLMGLDGAWLEQRRTEYPYPTPDRLTEFVRDEVAAIRAARPALDGNRIAGLGIACPFEIWNWLDIVGAPGAEMDAWRTLDITSAFSQATGLHVTVGNDATLACAAELRFGAGRRFQDFAYFTIGAFAGGGVVLDGAIYEGRTRNAGAFGTMPVRGPDQPGGQLLKHASLYLLETALETSGKPVETIWNGAENWDQLEPELDAWMTEAARHLALAAVGACSVIDFEAVMIDGAFPSEVRSELVRRVIDAFSQIDTQGIVAPIIVPGSLGRFAGAMGAAYQPLREKFF